ncbi:hypothetical protein HJ590_12105 [Naumannella sp. ID2617S]|nr:hypothetical protein [Naumannella sp. ID2617S]
MFTEQTAALTDLARSVTTGAVVTDDLAAVGNIVAEGKAAIVVMPPAITFDTPTARTLTWTVYLAAGPDPIRATPALDRLLDQLHSPLELTAAEPVSLPTHQGQLIAGYQLTTSSTYIDQ